MGEPALRYVGMFGDKLIISPVSKRNGVLAQTQKLNQTRGRDVGLATENGIWLFLEKAIREKEHWDNIFIFSDMQAGHGGLYGTEDGAAKYTKQGYSCYGKMIDVAKLINAYRSQVNPKVNVLVFKAQDTIMLLCRSTVIVPTYCMVGQVRKSSLQMK